MNITGQIEKILEETEKFTVAGTTDCAFWQSHLSTQLSVLKRLRAERPKTPVKKAAPKKVIAKKK